MIWPVGIYFPSLSLVPLKGERYIYSSLTQCKRMRASLEDSLYLFGTQFLKKHHNWSSVLALSATRHPKVDRINHLGPDCVPWKSFLKYKTVPGHAIILAPYVCYQIWGDLLHLWINGLDVILIHVCLFRCFKKFARVGSSLNHFYILALSIVQHFIDIQ